MDPLLLQLSSTVPRADSVEQLTRPLLEILSTVAGMESTYLTTIDLDNGTQHVKFARNAGDMQIPEGLDVPWDDTLCRRSLDEGRTYTPDVSECWGDSSAARALGIRTYVSAPVRASDGLLLGTLCAASASRQPLAPASEALLQLFSKLMGTWLERERLVAQLSEANERLATYALVDTLTGLPNRRAICDALERALAQAERDGTSVLVGLVDMDRFKGINDTYGHQVGDLFLRECAQRLQASLRGMDMIGRLGGDEFGVIAPGPAVDCARAVQLLEDRLATATVGEFHLRNAQFTYGGASVGVVAVMPSQVSPEEAFRLADAQMYRVKRERRELAILD
ncbi:diguanylate cyclase [Uliginosibacterium sp. sgz301328]|uniref:sensor domain-containing diguanylate cyclase n=1 Tax=Uliginosibacterium sp. sgz301328 TaxID=3243764 RepID=UPI00359F034A